MTTSAGSRRHGETTTREDGGTVGLRLRNRALARNAHAWPVTDDQPHPVKAIEGLSKQEIAEYIARGRA
jgi:hypothetical protein